jgi:glycosyltransferase involved in cell wall biosynthesis
MAAAADRLSVMLNTFNGGRKLERCLESVKWAGEIVVVDSGSTDGSPELAGRYTGKVRINPWPGYRAQREFGMSLCSGEWILILDQDEYCTAELASRLLSICADPAAHARYNAGWIRRIEHFWGKRVNFGNYNPSSQPRLARRGKCRWVGHAHSYMEVEGGEPAILRIGEPLWHDSYATPAEFFEKINRYSDLDVEERLPKGYRPSIWRVALSPLGMWWKCYVVRQGFRDGAHGFLNAASMAAYWFFRLSKAWHRRWLESNRPASWEEHISGGSSKK